MHINIGGKEIFLTVYHGALAFDRDSSGMCSCDEDIWHTGELHNGGIRCEVCGTVYVIHS